MLIHKNKIFKIQIKNMKRKIIKNEKYHLKFITCIFIAFFNFKNQNFSNYSSKSQISPKSMHNNKILLQEITPLHLP